MSKVLTILFAVLVILHGLVHLMGTTVYMKWDQIEALPYKTALLNGRWELGETGMKVFGSLWLIPLLGFLLSGTALLAGWSWGETVLAASALVSLVLTILDWQVAYAGIGVNIIILIVLELTRL